MSDIGHPEISARSVSAVIERLRAMPRTDTPRNLSPAALAAAAKHPPPAISPIVLAGMVRMAEFLLILVVGFAIYAKYVLVALQLRLELRGGRPARSRCSRSSPSRPPTFIRSRRFAVTRSNTCGSPRRGRSCSSPS